MHGLAAVPDGLLRRGLRIRALALRTLAVQLVAAGVALWMLRTGQGVAALVAFAVLNAVLGSAVTVLLARWRPKGLPALRMLRLLWPKTVQIIARALLNTGLFPLVQLMIGLTLGPAAAGAFQIATRMVELIEALMLSPMRFVSLPELRTVPDLPSAVMAQLGTIAMLSTWVWCGVWISAPDILRLAVGADHTTAAVPLLRALAPFALISALSMPVVQALNAKGYTALVLGRAFVLLGIGTLMAGIGLWLNVQAVAAAVSVSAILVSLWFVPRALNALSMAGSNLLILAKPLGAAGVMILTLLALPLPFAAQVVVGTAVYGAVLLIVTHSQRQLA
ncbi:oligosaccharide flippase family protein [Sulfitobacter aestuariivivens]|uniref:oligosaccharide flippase family protein n=1 Tax=Sulfitobacter aestuariivivens TaxID=2766981 RepID=UPI0036114508